MKETEVERRAGARALTLARTRGSEASDGLRSPEPAMELEISWASEEREEPEEEDEQELETEEEKEQAEEEKEPEEEEEEPEEEEEEEKETPWRVLCVKCSRRRHFAHYQWCKECEYLQFFKRKKQQEVEPKGEKEPEEEEREPEEEEWEKKPTARVLCVKCSRRRHFSRYKWCKECHMFNANI